MNALPINPKDFEHIVGEVLLASCLLTNTPLEESGDFFGLTRGQAVKICNEAALRLWSSSSDIKEVITRSKMKIDTNDAQATILRFESALNAIYFGHDYKPKSDILNLGTMRKSENVLVAVRDNKVSFAVCPILQAPTWTIL